MPKKYREINHILLEADFVDGLEKLSERAVTYWPHDGLREFVRLLISRGSAALRDDIEQKENAGRLVQPVAIMPRLDKQYVGTRTPAKQG